VLHRLFASGSDRAGERWREDDLIPRSEALKLHHLYRAMAFLGQEIESRGQKTLGTPRCLKDSKEQLRSRDRSLVGNKGYRRYLKLEGSGHFVIDEKQVKAEKRFR